MSRKRLPSRSPDLIGVEEEREAIVIAEEQMTVQTGRRGCHGRLMGLARMT